MVLVAMRELPWERVTIAHLGYGALLQIILFLIAVCLFVVSLSGKKRGGLIMRVTLKHPNYPFYFVAAGWVGFLWFTISRGGQNLLFWSGTDLPKRMVEDMMMQSVLRTTTTFMLFFIWGLVVLHTMFYRQEIRGNGLKDGIGFVAWKLIDHCRWISPGDLRVYYRVPERRFLYLPVGKDEDDEALRSFLWEMTPNQEPEVRQQLERFLSVQLDQ